MRKADWKRRMAAAVLMGSTLIGAAGCGNEGEVQDLMEKVPSITATESSSPDEKELVSASDTFIKLFQAISDGRKNMMVSPASVISAMSMVEKGARGETQSQLKEFCKDGDNISRWLSSMQKERGNAFSCANSIWFRDNDESFQVKQSFLLENEKTRNAELYSTDFGDGTAERINEWVQDKTGGMILKIIDKMDEQTVMHLINAVAFKEKWQEPYEEEEVTKDLFMAADGTWQEARYLCSTEEKYINDDLAQGFIKPYQDGFSFVALLPNTGVSLREYIQKLSGKKLASLIKGAAKKPVKAKIPKFTAEYEVQLAEALKSLGITDAFVEEKADLSGIGTDKQGNLHISSVLHKTYIEVNEQGTKAGAATDIAIDKTSQCTREEIKVELTRPFFYAVIDDATKLPIFIGTVTNM